MLGVSVLGPVEVRRDGGRVALPSGKTTEVLLRLALDAGQPVRAEQVIHDLWHGVVTGKNTLQSKVSQLRRALGDPEVVTAGHGGYTLNVAPAQVDALAVRPLAEAVSAARRAGEHEVTVARADEALALFRGDVLVDAGDSDWVQPHRARLEEVRLGLLEDRLAALTALGSGGDVVGELEALVARHPLREGLWSSLVTALYRAGRQADALSAYTRVRDLLREELGVEPGPGLRELEEQVLRHSSALAARPGAAAGVPGNLPGLSSSLVGRESDLAAVSALLREHRLVTLVGPAGVGKTRTAIEVARGLTNPAGVWLVRLDAVADPDEVPRAVAEALEVPGGEGMLIERFAGADAILVLDNCEHVVDAVSALVARLMDGTPSLRVLATSQVPLGLQGETVHALGPLSPGESVELFITRATQLRPTAVPEDDAAAVAELCRSLDGLPLAIELAAARAKSLSVPEIARRLEDRFALLTDPTSHAPERRRGLEAAVGWSYDLLFPDDQRGLWALSVFAGGAPLPAAEHVLEALGVPRESALDVVDRLASRSLVSVESGPDGAVRFRLLDSIRAFARARLRESGDEPATCTAHAGWFAGVAARCADAVRGAGQAACLDVVRAERANVDATLTWCAEHDPRQGVEFAVGLGWAWVVLGDGVTGAARVRDAWHAAGDVDARLSVEALLLAGWLEASAGNVVRAEADLDGVASRLDDLDEPLLRADLHRHRAFLGIQQGRPDDVLLEAGASLEIDRPAGRSWQVAAALLLAAYGAIMLGDTSRATESAEEAVGLLAPIDDPWGMVHAHGMLGAIAQAEHRFDEAAVELAGAAEESEGSGFLGQAALHLTRLGRVEQQRGRTDAAVETLDRANAAARTGGDLRIAATARTTLARLLWCSGDLVAALALLEQNDAWYRTAGGDGALLTRCLIGVLTSRPASTTSTRRLAALLEEAEAAGDAEAALVVLDAMARLAADEGDPGEARRLLERADQHHAGVRHLVDDGDRVDVPAARRAIEHDLATG